MEGRSRAPRPPFLSVRGLYNEQYSHLANPAPEEDDNRDFLQVYLDNLMPNKVNDEWEDYAKGSRLPKLDNSVYDWWKTQDHTPSVRKMAYDLCVPGMSTEIERSFRGTKLAIPETRKRLEWQVIEAGEVTRGLFQCGLL